MYVISLIILFLCAADGLAPKCTKAENFKQKCKDKKHILLLNTSDSQDINQFKTFSDDVEVIDEICPGGVQGLLAATTVLPLIHEQYCTAKRLYYAFNSRSNNVGATITALSLPPVAQVLEAAGESTSNLLRAVASGYDASAAAASANKALLRAAERIQL
ncbi:fibroin light chain [Manduca sexta]|uniref:fibroin light chain n=1 Tax=Manduca sexta TaxID=7130 RepID=UPI00189085B5|nr:fibroin light chain [Manduca sexta]